MGEAPARIAGRPPLTPRWAYEPWVWEDTENTAQAVLELVDGYRQRGIPVGAVIVDSPWATHYNSFEFGPGYPDPAGFVRELHSRGVRVLCWTTNYLNTSSIDGPNLGKAPSYDEALQAGYFIEGGRTFAWWKGQGSAIDFFNPAAVSWWYRQIDKVFSLEIDGFKVDNGEHRLPSWISTAAGRKNELEYGDAYYRAFYRYVAERKPDGIITARPYDGGRYYAPIDALPAGWVGDQEPNWGDRGLEEALENILVSAESGYAVVGSDIGAYSDGERDEDLFIRWSQLGALSPLMENGGVGEHRPWALGDDVLRAYRYYAKLHHQLVPYLYSLGVEAHRTGKPIIRNVDRPDRQYTLGEDLLVAPIVERRDEREVELLDGARWHDYWDDDRIVVGPREVRHEAPTERMPLWIRGGAIIPMQVDDPETGHGSAGSASHLTLLVYPEGASERTYYPDADRAVPMRARRQGGASTFEIGPQTERYVLRIKEPARPSTVRLDRGGSEIELPGQSDYATFEDATEGWYYDANRRYLWVRFATQNTGARVSYPVPN
jgi:alpha-glucosidase (family GH31 glycosyl hydrolase)